MDRPAETPMPSHRARNLTAGAAAVAALAGVAVAGGAFAGADTTPRANATAVAAAAAAKPTPARVLVKRGPRGKTGRTGARGLRGTTGPTGPAAADVARSFTLNWSGGWNGRDTASAVIPGLGVLGVTCNPATQQLVLAPASAAVRTVLTADVFSGTMGDHQRVAVTGTPAVVQLPVSGVITATISVEPLGGDGGPGPAPATLTLSVESKSNADPADPKDQNSCYVAGQVLRAGA